MQSHRSHAQLRRGLTLFATLLLAAAVPSATWAQAKKPFLIVTTKDSVTAPGDPQENPVVELRARKGSQPVYLFVNNPKEDAIDGVTVEFRTGPGDAKPLKTTINLDKKATKQVKFPRPPAPVPPAPLGGSTFQVRVSEPGAKDDDPWQTVKIINVPLTSLIQGTPKISFNGQNNTVTATLQGAKDLDSPCQVTMEILPERMPGLQQTIRVSRPVTKGQTVNFVSPKLPITPGESGNGIVYFHVDQMPRALVFSVPYGSPDPDQGGTAINTGMFLRAPLFALTGSKVSIGVELVGTGIGDGKVDLDLGHMKDDTFTAETRCPDQFPGRRTPLTQLDAQADDGALLLSVTMPDTAWELTADDTKEFVGEKFLQASIDDKPVGKPTPIIFIKDPPANVRLTIVRKNDKIYELQAKTDTQAPFIAKALFFLGRPDGGKIPDGSPVVAAKYNPETDIWVAEMELEDKATVTVQMVNRVGLGIFRTVDFVAPPPAGPAGATISGIVDVGGQIQKGVEVKLAVKPQTTPPSPEATVKTDDKGRYTFTDVKAGSYTISCVKESGNFKRADSKDVSVKSGDKLKQDLSLSQLKK